MPIKLIVSKVIKDPHHGGFSEWCVFDGRFYTRSETQTNWVEVKKIHPTPARIMVLAELLRGGGYRKKPALKK